MEPLVWLDVTFILSASVLLPLAAWRFGGRQGLTLGGVLLLLLGVGALAGAAIDISLAKWDKLRKPTGFATIDGPPNFTAGKPAADFCLPSLEDGRPIRLSDFRGRKPVFLVFSSFT
jgi:hypothetical protein